ncbi:MAG TPA: DUF1569 domain-containing protein [Chitinophagaceae bacterium]
MTYLFDPAESSRIISRITRLTAESKPLWGKMTVSQMLAHCQMTLRVALGEHPMKRNLFGILFGRMAKKALVSDKPYKRGLPTAPSFIIKNDPDFETERDKLVALVERFSKGGEAALMKGPHPFFGPMTAAEWDKSQWKHLDHHLQQFGV